MNGMLWISHDVSEGISSTGPLRLFASLKLSQSRYTPRKLTF